MKKTLIIILMLAVHINAQGWQQWRGPEANCVVDSTNAPVKFSATEGILWQTELPGQGASTPIISNERIIITSGIGEGTEGEDGVLCFDWTGKQLWSVKLGKQRPGKHPVASGSNPSPVTDGKLIFAYYKSGTLAALDFDGKIIWQTNLQKTYGRDSLWWDLGTSPVLADENVVIAVMHEGNSYVAALKKETGEEAWKVDRNYAAPKETRQSYTTPIVLKEGGKTALVIWGSDHLTCHDAETGVVIWDCAGFNESKKPLWRVIASPTISEGIAVVPFGRGQYMAGIKIGGKGDITSKARAWERKGPGTDSACPVIADGKVYIVNFKGKVWCLDLKKGHNIWTADLPNGKGSFFSSPLLVGDKMYFCRQNGDVFVCQVSSSGMKVLNTANFNDEFAATPVLVDGKLLLRGEKNLYCIGGAEQPEE